MNVVLLLVHDLDQNFNAINNSLTRGTRSSRFQVTEIAFSCNLKCHTFTLQESDPSDDDNYYNTFFLGIPTQVN